MSKKNILQPCISELSINCKNFTRSKSGICSMCQEELQNLVNNIELAKILGYKPNFNYKINEKDNTMPNVS